MARRCKNWVASYKQYTENSESPLSFHIWTALYVLASALEARVELNMGNFRWVPNMYLFLIARPGVATKSTTINIGKRFLRETKVRFGPQSMTWQGLAEAFLSAQKPILMPGEDPLMGQHDVQAALSVFVSELGTFLDTKNRDLIDFLTDMWDGQKNDFIRHTVAHGEVRIPNPMLSVIGATTPAWFTENFGPELIGTGFASRMMLVYGKAKRKYIAWPDLYINEEHEKLREDLIEDLVEISQMTGPMKMTEEVRTWGDQYYVELNKYMEQGIESDRKQDYLARKFGHIMKIAIIMSIARTDDMIITMDDVTKSMTVLGKVERDMDYILGNITSAQQQARNKQELSGYLNGGKEFEKQDLYRKVHTWMSWRDFDIAVTDLLQARQIDQVNKGGKTLLRLRTPKTPGKTLSIIPGNNQGDKDEIPGSDITWDAEGVEHHSAVETDSSDDPT